MRFHVDVKIVVVIRHLHGVQIYLRGVCAIVSVGIRRDWGDAFPILTLSVHGDPIPGAC